MNQIENYGDMVRADLRADCDPSVSHILNCDLKRWAEELHSITKDIDAQMALRKSDSYAGISSRPEYERWKGQAMKFKNAVNDRYKEVKRRIHEQSQSGQIPSEQKPNVQELVKLNDKMDVIIGLLTGIAQRQ